MQQFQAVLDAIPEIRYVGDPILRQVTEPTTQEEGVEIAKRLELVLLKYRSITGRGRGLAAPQIGESKSVFITFVDDKIETFMNPRVIEKSLKTNFYRELCMSTGIMSADVERPDWIVLEWMDETGRIHSGKVDGFKARLCQHEEAHLRGVLNVDEAVSGGIEFATFDPLKERLRDAV